MIGFPGETLAEVLKTCWFIIKSPLCIAYIFKPIPFDGTALKEIVQETAGNTTDDYVDSLHNYSKVPNGLLGLIIFITNILFYGNPIRIVRVFRLIPSRSFLFLTIKRFIRTIIMRKSIKSVKSSPELIISSSS